MNWRFLGLSGLLLSLLAHAVSSEPQSNTLANSCSDLISCPLCPIQIEWPLDFDGDNLAETVQHRVCSGEGFVDLQTADRIEPIPESRSPFEIIIVLNWRQEPIFYQSNQKPYCELGEIVRFGRLKRLDFLQDNYDELMLTEYNLTRKFETLRLLGYSYERGRIGDLIMLDFRDQLKDYGTSAESKSEDSKEPPPVLSFESLLGQDGFIARSELKDGRMVRVYYFQDSTDRIFYPLKVINESPLSPQALQASPLMPYTMSLFYVNQTSTN
ncbi:MAG: hypothetical protein SFT81_03675 [Candidatus Caenarcaniphilales bacterium]|nr:hypothetical protein [Candidatus Caenarcaniphilales bacterium]